MASVDITVNPSGADLLAGDQITSGAINHFALVQARRSRADGFDLRLQYQGDNIPFQVAGANTTTMTITFVLVDGIPEAGDEAGDYDLIFGNLGAQDDLSSVVTGNAPGGTPSAVATVPALDLPRPGFPLETEYRSAVLASLWPESVALITRVQHRNVGALYRLKWANISAEDYYEIEAFEYAVLGTAGTFRPSWLAAGIYQFTEPVIYSQGSRLEFEASATVEEVYA